MNDSLDERILDLPKIDLHRHLDGSVRTRTLLELGQQQGVDLPGETVEELNRHVTVPADCRSLSDFLDCFETFYPVLQTPEAVERIAYEVCEDLDEEGVVYAEVRFAPILLTEEGHSQAEIVEAALRGLAEGNRDFETVVNLILCLYRGTSVDDSLRTVEVARRFRDDGVVGLDLAGDESQYAARNHKEAFDRAKEYGFNFTIHAGEAGPAGNVREALDVGADRIGHGVRSVDDEALLDRLREESVPLEVCLTSNLQTQAVETLDDHPIRAFFENGLHVTVNTDDPRVSRTSLNEEYRLLAQTWNFDFDDIIVLLNNAVDAAFADESVVESLREKTLRAKEAYSDE